MSIKRFMITSSCQKSLNIASSQVWLRKPKLDETYAIFGSYAHKDNNRLAFIVLQTTRLPSCPCIYRPNRALSLRIIR